MRKKNETRGRKKWVVTNKPLNILKSNKVVDYTITWASEIKNEANLKKWVKPNTPLTIEQACLEADISRMTFYYYRENTPAIREKHIQFKANRRELLKDKSEDTIYNALHWGMNISDKDILDTAKWMSEKTDRAYNPKIEIEAKSMALNFELSVEDIEEQLMELIRK